MKKWWILVVYLIVVIIVYLNKEFLWEWIQDSDLTDLPYMFLLSAFIATVPVVPFTVFAGLMGVKYGTFTGLLINWWGGVTASIIYFLLARHMFAGFFGNYIKQFRGIHRFNYMIEKNAFIAILFSRLVPVIPPPVVNIYSGLTKISFWIYLSASAIGKLPPMFIFAYGGDHIFSSWRYTVAGLSAYVLFLFIVFLIYRVWVRNKTKRRLV
ncbi:TVP38/TMEM64 family protein [Alkalihalobacillus sp. TS-13]|uniref:TVP38/TMEM64 family protein n=1 Tax=Alkalihalobacillus sp. TS-13 TaxID=2842455 RepID=UPI001C879EA2|nr:VTT domain-containing protein [Alkalihalobacillus sp. TS-13]